MGSRCLLAGEGREEVFLPGAGSWASGGLAWGECAHWRPRVEAQIQKGGQGLSVRLSDKQKGVWLGLIVGGAGGEGRGWIRVVMGQGGKGEARVG